MNPDIAAAALDTEAALARIGAAGRFPDPMFKTELWDVRAARDTALPQAGRGQVHGRADDSLVGQARPAAEDRQRRGRFGFGAASGGGNGPVGENQDGFRGIVGNAGDGTDHPETFWAASLPLPASLQSRYGQGRGNQQDVVTAEVERGRLQADLARLDGQRRGWMAQMNALLNRPAGALLAPPQALQPVPDADAMPLADLLERVRRDNPQLASEQSTITAAERNAELARRNWYPDPTFGFTVFDEDGGSGRQFGGYEAMISFAIPLQWGLRRAQEQEALAKAAASRTRREASATDLRGQLEEAYWALDAARRGESILRDINIPQANVLLRPTLAGYELGRADLPSVLLAEQAVLRVTLDRIALLVEQQTRLAELERVIGGDL